MRPKPASFGFIFNQDKSQILLVQRKDVAVWTLPGGGIDDGESPEEAVIRELREETGFTTKIVRKVALYTPINRLSASTHTFECQIVIGTMTNSEESRAIAFHPIHKLPSSFFFLHREWLLDCLQNQSVVIQKPLSSITYFKALQMFFRHPLRVMRFVYSKFWCWKNYSL